MTRQARTTSATSVYAILLGMNYQQVFDFETYIDSTDYEKIPDY